MAAFGLRRCMGKPVRICLSLLVLHLVWRLEAVVAGDALPEVSVSSIRPVFHNGEHNAFTDLCRFQGQLYLTFRSCPDGHMVHPTASIMILRSLDDGAHWEPVHRFSVKDRDTRDPHFLVFRNRLFVYTGTWYSGPGTIKPEDYDLNKHLGFAAWSDDGATWNSPVLLEGTFGHYIWRAASFEGKAYLCGRRKLGFEIGPRGEGEKIQSLMLESDDGLVWKKRAYFQETAGDETAFLFQSDGGLLGVGRHGGGKNAQLLRAKPPYADWERKDLGRSIGGPLLAKWGDRIVVGGRMTTAEKGPKTALCWLVGDELKEFAELPSGGDNSYPGFVELSPQRALVSYYSSHERDPSGKVITAIYLAELTLKPWKPHEVRQMNGTGGEIRLPSQFQMVTENWNRVVAVPYIIYMPEKDRLLMLVNCDYPHHAEVLFSDDHGASWSRPKPVFVGTDGKPVAGMGTSLCYLGEGNVLFYGSARWFSRDYGQTWKESVPLTPATDGKPWYTWDPPLVERDAKTGKVARLIETGYTWFKPPEVKTAHQQGYLRFSTDEGTRWSPSAKIPQWEAVSEVALLRAANGHLVAACRTDTPARMQPEVIDHTEGLGISISTDEGQTWSAVRKLYDWGRHHPSLILLPGGEIVMTYVVRKGYVNTPDGFPQFGIEAVVSRDHGETWDLDHKYILHHWIGHIKDGPTAWYPSSQATSSVLLPDGSILTAFGTGYRCQDIVKGQPAPRDAGLIRWRLNADSVNAETKLRDAPFDSELRNAFDPDRH